MKPIQQIGIAETDEIFDKVLRDSAATVRFKDDAAEEAYGKKSELLTSAIVAVTEKLFPPEPREEQIHVIWDCWQDRTRFLELGLDAMTQEFFDALRKLLSGEFKSWRIQLVVFGSLQETNNMIGSVLIWPDKLLIDRALYAVLKWQGIDFHCSNEPTLLQFTVSWPSKS